MPVQDDMDQNKKKKGKHKSEQEIIQQKQTVKTNTIQSLEDNGPIYKEATYEGNKAKTNEYFNQGKKHKFTQVKSF